MNRKLRNAVGTLMIGISFSLASYVTFDLLHKSSLEFNIPPAVETTYKSSDNSQNPEIKFNAENCYEELSSRAKLRFDRIKRSLYEKPVSKGSEPYIDFVNEVREITGLPWDLYMAQLEKEISSLDPTRDDSKSKDNGIGSLQITYFGYMDVKQEYKRDPLVKEILDVYNIRPVLEWEELLKNWQNNRESYEFQKELLVLGATCMAINRERFERLYGSELSKKEMDELVIIAHHAGIGGVLKAIEKAKSARVNDILPYLGPNSQKYITLIESFQPAYQEIEEKCGILSSESFNQE